MRQFKRIKGEDKPQNVIRLPRVGKIRLGIKKVSAKTGKEYPTETDYFVCPPEIQAKYGKEPKSLPVMLPVEDEEMLLRQYYACYGGNQKLKCQGDAEFCARRKDDGQIEELPCPGPLKCDFGAKNKCAARIDIMVVLPDVNCGSTYQLSTGSINSDIDIRSGIEMAKHLYGRISWVPMMLVREEKKIADPATGKMQTHWPVKLYPNATITEVNTIRQDTKRILDRQKHYALDEPIMEGSLADTPTVVSHDIEEEREALPAATADPAPHPSPSPTETSTGEEKKGTPKPATPPVTHGEKASLPSGEHKESAEKSKTDNYEYLKTITPHKKRVGQAAYYRALGGFGYEHADEICNKNVQAAFWRALKSLPDAQSPPNSCTKNPVSCEHSVWDEAGKPHCKPIQELCLFPEQKEG